MVDVGGDGPVEDGRVASLHVAQMVDARELRLLTHRLGNAVRFKLLPFAGEAVSVIVRMDETLFAATVVTC